MRTPWTTASPQDLTLALYESASVSRWSPHPLTTRAQHQTASSPPPPSTMSPPSSSSWSSHLRAISQVVCSHIVWNKKKGGPARCVLPDYCSSDRRNIGPLLPRLLPVTCSNTASAVIQLRDNCKTTLGQLWDSFGTTVRQLWDNFETSLKQLLPGLLPVTCSNTSSSVIQSPSSTFSRLLLLVFFTYMTLFEYACAILDWTHVLHSQNVKQ